MKKNYLVAFALFASMLTLSSCVTSYMASYSVGLSSVESPADAKKQFGETKVVTFKDGEVDKYRYEDDFIEIVWYVGLKKFNFELKNKSTHTMKINWDDVSYVDINGKTRRVMHAGVKYIERNNSQPATSIPKGASLSDILLPTDNVILSSGLDGGWIESNLIPSYYSTSEAMANGAESYVGKKMTILMPIMIENVQNDYTFVFNIDKWLNKK
jgi:putative lipoprotein